ncbi:putative Ulp1 protease family catalytic domain-containing protein [Heracleum sosnowskyi]|uniref:Ulp1 protease family catalytic domain-containing protein n=1 Tax=Heracleum sosnowskyi TaxID=360622 RepID=A0AAD8I2Q5_9APIA|nr:putative Ulp1 protease family catalytic domain-containing protein [Heracleum sosnowskyi]
MTSARYLSEVFLSKNPDLTAKFSFVSPHLVSHLVDSSDTNLAKCLLGHIDKDHLLLLPYNVSKHWVLVAINAKTEMIYYMDPARMTNAINYKKVKALEKRL